MWYVISSNDARYFFGGWVLRPTPRPTWVNHSRAAEKFHAGDNDRLVELQDLAKQLDGELIRIPAPTSSGTTATGARSTGTRLQKPLRKNNQADHTDRR
jgi:hypothetical protein